MFVFQYKAELVKAFTEEVLPNFTAGHSIQLQPIVDSVFPFDQIADAHRRMEANKNMGKIILQIPVWHQEGNMYNNPHCIQLSMCDTAIVLYVFKL